MFELIGSLFSLAFGLVKMGFGLAWGMVEFILGILGGIFSLVMSLGGFVLAGALVLVAIFRRKEYKQRRHHPYEETESRTYDVDTEEFTSFYDQYRTSRS